MREGLKNKRFRGAQWYVLTSHSRAETGPIGLL